MSSNSIVAALLLVLVVASSARASTTSCSITDADVFINSDNTSCDVTVATQEQTKTTSLSGSCELLCGNSSALIVQSGLGESTLTLVTDGVLLGPVELDGDLAFAAPSVLGLQYSGTETHWIPVVSSGTNQSGTETHWVVPPGSTPETHWLVFSSTHFATVWTSGTSASVKLASSSGTIDWDVVVSARLDHDASGIKLSCMGDCTL